MLDQYNKNKNSFKVPEGYFENLTQHVMSNLPEKEIKQVKKARLWKKFLPLTGIAALIAALAISVSIFDYNPSFLSANHDEEEAKVGVTEQSVAYNHAEDYFLFLEDEAESYEYEDMLFEEYNDYENEN